MLSRIAVRNLACYDDKWYEVDFSEETLLAGPNNSGKSMLLAGMNLLRNYIVSGRLSWNSPYYRLHNFEAAVYNHDMDRKIELSITLKEGRRQYVFHLTTTHRSGTVFMLSDKHISAGKAEHTDLMRKIWCFSPNRSIVPYQTGVQPTGGPIQPLTPNGSNVINYLLERWTDRDEKWDVAESWLRKIDPDMSQLKTPITGNQVSLETLFGNTDVNVSLQGSGFQSAAAIVSAIVFSPERSTIVIEEPEAFLHPSSQEVIVDMINDAVNNHNKQVIFSTHSCNILLPFYRDIGIDGVKRDAEHVSADPKKFSMWTFKKTAGRISIEPYPLDEQTFQHFKDKFRYIWG